MTTTTTRLAAVEHRSCGDAHRPAGDPAAWARPDGPDQPSGGLPRSLRGVRAGQALHVQARHELGGSSRAWMHTPVAARGRTRAPGPARWTAGPGRAVPAREPSGRDRTRAVA